MEELMYIQSKIHAPKESENKFGKYKYRKAEQILEAAKPLLAEKSCTLVVSDEIVMIGNFIYVKATSILTNKSGESVSAVGWAREADSLSGMSPGQVTGATSSYARKYSLCGLFAIDDTKDLDDESVTNPQQKQRQSRSVPSGLLDQAIQEIASANSKEELLAIHNNYGALQQDINFKNALTERKNQIS